MNKARIYRVRFINEDETWEVFARDVHQSHLYGFIEIEELVFGERSRVLVDPAEEKLKAQFEGVRRSFIPVHSVIRIDEVDKEGTARITAATGNKVRTFPGPVPGPRDQ